MGFKSNNSSIKLKRKKKRKKGNKVSISHYTVNNEKKDSSEMLDYFTKIKIQNKQAIENEYNIKDNCKSASKYVGTKKKKASKNIFYSNHKYFKTTGVQKSSIGSNVNPFDNQKLYVKSKYVKNDVSISKNCIKSKNQLNIQSKIKNKSPNKYKITSLAQLFKKRSSRSKSKNKKNKSKFKQKKSKNFRITNKCNNTFTPKYSDVEGKLSSYLKASSIKPFYMSNTIRGVKYLSLIHI